MSEGAKSGARRRKPKRKINRSALELKVAVLTKSPLPKNYDRFELLHLTNYRPHLNSGMSLTYGPNICELWEEFHGRKLDRSDIKYLRNLWRGEFPGAHPRRTRGDEIINFIELLTVPSGRGSGKSFKLMPFQKDFIKDVFDPSTEDENDPDLRVMQRREAILSIARKNGKTALIAAVAICYMIGPRAQFNGEIYSAANDRKQSAIIFKFLRQIIQMTPELVSKFNIYKNYSALVPSTMSEYHALSKDAKTKHGLRPVLGVYDELAQARDRELYDTITTAQGACYEPLMLVISTQARDPNHIMSELVDEGLRRDNPAIITHLYAVDDNVIDIMDEAEWPKANPALGAFRSLDEMRNYARRVVSNPSSEGSFRNLYLNQRVDADAPFISLSRWDSCKVTNLGHALIQPGEDVYIGLDLSNRLDLTAAVVISADTSDRIMPFFWTPRDGLAVRAQADGAPYQTWVGNNHLLTTPGPTVDYDPIARHVDYLRNVYNVVGLAYDPWRIQAFIQSLERSKIPHFVEGSGSKVRINPATKPLRLVGYRQGFQSMSPAIEELEISIATHNFNHDGNPVLAWCVANAKIITDTTGNKKLDKSQQNRRIDGAVALLMALGLKYQDKLTVKPDIQAALTNPIVMG